MERRSPSSAGGRILALGLGLIMEIWAETREAHKSAFPRVTSCKPSIHRIESRRANTEPPRATAPNLIDLESSDDLKEVKID